MELLEYWDTLEQKCWLKTLFSSIDSLQTYPTEPSKPPWGAGRYLLFCATAHTLPSNKLYLKVSKVWTREGRRDLGRMCEDPSPSTSYNHLVCPSVAAAWRLCKWSLICAQLRCIPKCKCKKLAIQVTHGEFSTANAFETVAKDFKAKASIHSIRCDNCNFVFSWVLLHH